MSDGGPWRSPAFRALSPAGRRLYECVSRELNGRHEIAVSRSAFREIDGLSAASVTLATRQCRALGLLSVTPGPRSVYTYARSDEWRALDAAAVAVRRAQLPRRRPAGRVKAPMRWRYDD